MTPLHAKGLLSNFALEGFALSTLAYGVQPELGIFVNYDLP